MENFQHETSTALSADKKSDDFSNYLRIYYDEQNHIDLELYQSNMNDNYFIKDKKSFKTLKDILNDKFFSFIDKLTDESYIKFLQEKNYDNFSIDLDKSFPSELVIPSFHRDSYMDSLSQLEITSKSYLDISEQNQTVKNFCVMR